MTSPATAIERYLDRTKKSKTRTALHRYIARIANDRRRAQHFNNLNPKQVLVELNRHGDLTTLQMRAAARVYDRRLADGADPEELLAKILDELATGRLELGAQDREAKATKLKLSELRKNRPGLSAKQQLLELREAGALSPKQTKAAATLMAKGHSVEQALVEVEAQHLLDELPAPPDDEDTDPQEEDDPEDDEQPGNQAERAGDQEGDPGSRDESDPAEEGAEEPGDAPAGAAAPAPTSAEEASRDEAPETKLSDILDLNVQVPDGDERDSIEKALRRIQHKPALLQLLMHEEQGKTRITAIELIKERFYELGGTPEELGDEPDDEE